MQPPSSPQQPQNATDDQSSATSSHSASSPLIDTADEEVAQWVHDATARRLAAKKAGFGSPEGGRPALHAVALDAVNKS